VSSNLDEALKFVASYAGSAKEWKVIKKELLKFLPPEERKKFSTRDAVTKAANFNEFESEVAKKWADITGNDVIFTKGKI